MTFKPILFSTPMVQAILEGRKTQTRRIMQPQPEDSWMQDCKKQSPNLALYDKRTGLPHYWISDGKDGEIIPKATLNTVLWVRETWQFSDDLEEPYLYRQQYEEEHLPEFWKSIKWKPSIFMPKEACRLFLEVTNVRVERLQDISEADAVAEGIMPIVASNDSTRVLGYRDYMIDPKLGFNTLFNPKHSFESLWRSINGPESWEANPWCWVYSFTKVEKPTPWP